MPGSFYWPLCNFYGFLIVSASPKLLEERDPIKCITFYLNGPMKGLPRTDSEVLSRNTHSELYRPQSPKQAPAQPPRLPSCLPPGGLRPPLAEACRAMGFHRCAWPSQQMFTKEEEWCLPCTSKLWDSGDLWDPTVRRWGWGWGLALPVRVLPQKPSTEAVLDGC